MIDFVSQFYMSAKKMENQKVAQKDFTIINQQFEESFKDFDDETIYLEEDLILSQKKRREDLRRQQAHELLEFEERWNSDKKKRIYNKSTNKLNTMRSRIPFLLVDNRFDEAEDAQKDIDDRTHQEVFDNHFIMQKDYDKSLRLLLIKQYNETQMFETDCDVELEKFKQNRLKLRQGFLNRRLKLKTKKDIIDDPNKLWAHSQIERISNAGKSSTSKSLPLCPSSKMKVADFREPEYGSLALPPLESHLKSLRRSLKMTKKE